jgi:hypothetical protein
MIFADAVPAGQAVAQVTKGASSFGPTATAPVVPPPAGPEASLFPSFFPASTGGGSGYTTPLLALGGVALAGIAGFLIWKKIKG